jgi:hypothetical protein
MSNEEMSELQKQWKKEKEERKVWLRERLVLLWPAMERLNVTKAVVAFEGSGDSGEVGLHHMYVNGKKIRHEGCYVYLYAAGDNDEESEETSAFEGMYVPDYPTEVSNWVESRGSWEYQTIKREEKLTSVLVSLGARALSEAHGGWEVNEGSHGKIIFDVQTGVTIDCNERVIAEDNYVTNIPR